MSISGKVITLAKKGEIATCQNGHPMFEVLEDIFSGGIVKSSDFKALGDVPKPVGGCLAPGCPICGTLCIAHPDGKFPDGAQIHIGNEWRSNKNPYQVKAQRTS